MKHSDDYVLINVDILRVTLQAIQVRCSDNVPRWIPRSLVFGPHDSGMENRVGQLMAIKVFRWAAEKNGIPLARGAK